MFRPSSMGPSSGLVWLLKRKFNNPRGGCCTLWVNCGRLCCIFNPIKRLLCMWLSSCISIRLVIYTQRGWTVWKYCIVVYQKKLLFWFYWKLIEATVILYIMHSINMSIVLAHIVFERGNNWHDFMSVRISSSDIYDCMSNWLWILLIIKYSLLASSV